MSFIELPGLSEVKEKYPVPGDALYDLCITSVKVEEKEGKTNIRVILEIEGEPDAANVFHYLSLPGPNDDDEKKKIKMLFLARFLHQFGLDADNGLETEQMVGARASGCKLTLDEYDGRLSNNFSPALLPKED